MPRPRAPSAARSRFERRTACEPQPLAGEHVDGDDVKLDRHLFEPVVCGLLGDQRTQARIGHEMIARSEEAAQAAERTKRGICPRRTSRQISTNSSVVLTVCGRAAINPALIGPTEVPAIRSAGELTLVWLSLAGIF
jgi:hypothetical protein